MSSRPHTRSRARRLLAVGLRASAIAGAALGAGGLALAQVESQRAEVRELEGQLIEVESQASQAAGAHAQAQARVSELRGEIAQNAVDTAEVEAEMFDATYTDSAQGTLDDQQVVGGAVQMSCESMPQAMRRQVLIDTSLFQPVANPV